MPGIHKHKCLSSVLSVPARSSKPHLSVYLMLTHEGFCSLAAFLLLYGVGVKAKTAYSPRQRSFLSLLFLSDEVNPLSGLWQNKTTYFIKEMLVFSHNSRDWRIRIKIQAFDEDLLVRSSHSTRLQGWGEHYKKPLSSGS